MVSEGAFLGNLAILLSAIDPKTKVLLVFPWLDSQAPVQDPLNAQYLITSVCLRLTATQSFKPILGKINHNCGASSNRLSKTILTFRYLMQKPVCVTVPCPAVIDGHRVLKDSNHLSKYGATLLTSDLNSEIK